MNIGFLLIYTETVYKKLPDRLRTFRTQTNEGNEQYSIMCLPVVE